MVKPHSPALAPLIMHSPRQRHPMGPLHPLPVLALKAAVPRAPSRLIQAKLSGSLVSTTLNIVLKQTSSSTLKGLAKILNDSFLDILIHIQQFSAPTDIIPLPSVRVLQKSSIEMVCIQTDVFFGLDRHRKPHQMPHINDQFG